MGRKSTVSVVVAAYNEARQIGGLLRSLDLQTEPPLEVIVVDDGSTDRTAAIASRAAASVLRRAHRGPAAARNAGAACARGDVLVFLAGDMECAPEFLERLVAPIASGAAIGTFTREMYLANRHRRWARAYAALRFSPPDRLLPAGFPDRVAAGRTPWVLPARAVYHAAVVVGLCQAALNPGRHWK